MNKKARAELLKLLEEVPEAAERLVTAAEHSLIDGCAGHWCCLYGQALGFTQDQRWEALEAVVAMRNRITNYEKFGRTPLEAYATHFRFGDYGRWQRELVSFIQSSPYAVRREGLE